MTSSENVEYEDTAPALVRPYLPKPSREGRVIARVSAVGPVRLRLVGLPADVARTLDTLDQVFTLTNVSDIYPAPAAEIRVYASITRRYPYAGGTK